MTNNTASAVPQYTPPAYFINWLEQGPGRAAYFHKVDPGLFPPMISKMKAGLLPISFEIAIRLERAQKASDNPLKAEELMTFLEDRRLYRYVTGRDAAPAQLVKVRKSAARLPRTPAGAQSAAA